MRIALGTVQFGLDYGIANTTGRPTLDETRGIVELGRSRGMSVLDTAILYGDSERRLGEIGVRDWHVVTKLPEMPEDVADPAAWVAGLVRESLSRLRVTSLYGLLLHRPADLFKPLGNALFGALRQCQAEGLIQKIGVSVYSPEQLERLDSRFRYELVQGPLNVFDRRLAISGWIDRLSDRGIEFHARSAFLQGLLLMAPATRPPRFQRWQRMFAQYDEWLAAHALSRVGGALAAALAVPGVSQVVVGAQTRAQLAEILDASAAEPIAPPASLSSDDPDLLDPSRW